MTAANDTPRACLSGEGLAEIAAALKAADGWPWRYEKMGQMVFGHSVGGCTLTPSDYRVADVRGWGHLQYLGVERGDGKAPALQDANGNLIANAPEYISKLLSHIAALPTRTSGMTEEGAREILASRLNANGLESAAQLVRLGTSCGIGSELAISAITQALSEGSGQGGAEKMREAAVKAANDAPWNADGKFIAKAIRAIPLPPPLSGEVTEEEVEAACKAFVDREATQGAMPWSECESNLQNAYRRFMRSALLAARKVRG